MLEAGDPFEIFFEAGGAEISDRYYASLVFVIYDTIFQRREEALVAAFGRKGWNQRAI